MEEYFYIGNISFTQREIDALDKAIANTQTDMASKGVYHLLAEYARRDPEYPEFHQYQIDAYLEKKGVKPKDLIIPPRKLSGGYELDELYIRRGEILPQWRARGDGAVLYLHRWWGTESPASGWREYAWFKAKTALDYEQVSPWKPIEHYMHKRAYWQGEIVHGSLGPYRTTYSKIIKQGEIDLG